MKRPRTSPDGLSVACPKCGRRKGLVCAIQPYSGGPWEGYSKKTHTERIEAARAAAKERTR